MADRVRQGGHNIPESDIRRRFSKSLHNLLQLYRPVFGSLHFFDNSGNVPKENSTVNSNVTNGAAAIAPAPTIMPIYPQIAQDKGYIKVIFADYGKSNDSAIATVSKTNIGNMLGVGYRGQNMRDNIWVVLAIKSIVLIVLIWVIIIIAMRIIVNLQKIKRSKKSIAPIVKQVAKNRRRIHMLM